VVNQSQVQLHLYIGIWLWQLNFSSLLRLLKMICFTRRWDECLVPQIYLKLWTYSSRILEFNATNKWTRFNVCIKGVKMTQPSAIIDLVMKAVSACNTSVYFYETTRRYIPKGCHLHTRLCDSLKSHKLRAHYIRERLLPLGSDSFFLPVCYWKT
jgi:hypothetical protein